MASVTAWRSALSLIMAKAPKYPMLNVADKSYSGISVAVRAAFAAASKKTTEAAICSTLERGLKLLLPKLLAKAAISGADATVLPKQSTLRTAKIGKTLLTSVQAASKRWAEKHAAELITGISDVTRERIRSVLLQALPIREQIKLIKALVGDKKRAELIARTETLRAVHEGQRIVWELGIADGELDANLKRVWIITPDDRLCPICEALDGVNTEIGLEYPGEYQGPPAHPNCRCTEGLVMGEN